MKSLNKQAEIQMAFYAKGHQRLALCDAQKVIDLLYHEWEDIDEELEFKVLQLDDQLQLLTYYNIKESGMAAINDAPEQLFPVTCAHQSGCMILAHNTPASGENTALINELTQTILKAAQVYGITVLDYLVVFTKENYTSLHRSKHYRLQSPKYEVLSVYNSSTEPVTALHFSSLLNEALTRVIWN